MALGLFAVTMFSITLPVTKFAVPVFGGWTIGLGRSVIAGVLAIFALIAFRAGLPERQHLRSLGIIACGVVFGFPVLTALALEHVPASRGVIVVGLLPATTALIATIRHGERPSTGFWLAAAGGLLTVLTFAALTGSRGRPEPADALLALAVLAAAMGYAEGADLSKSVGSWQTICFALVLSLPITIPTTALAVRSHGVIDPTPKSVAALGYVAIFSMFLGFFVWYKALSMGGVSKVSQTQLAQPILSLGWTWLLLGESISGGAIVTAFAVVGFVGLAKRSSVKPSYSKSG